MKGLDEIQRGKFRRGWLCGTRRDLARQRKAMGGGLKTPAYLKGEPMINNEPETITIEDQSKEPLSGDLPNKPTLRISEVAAYYDVTERTVYLWIEHGHLETVLTPAGQKRIPREALDKCRFREKDAPEEILA